MRSEQLALITDILHQNSIMSRDIEIKENLYIVNVESENDENITSFVKGIIEKFNSKIKYVDIKSIYFDKKDSIYKGKLKIEFLGDK